MSVIKLKVVIMAVVLSGAMKAFSQNANAYLASYQFLAKTFKEPEMRVIDTLLNLDLTSFHEELAKDWKKKPAEILTMLDSIEYNNLQHLNKSLLPVVLRKKNANSKRLIYFSIPYKGMLAATVIEAKKGEVLSFNKQANFNQAHQFLFIFDRRNRIDNVYKKLIQFD